MPKSTTEVLEDKILKEFDEQFCDSDGELLTSEIGNYNSSCFYLKQFITQALKQQREQIIGETMELILKSLPKEIANGGYNCGEEGCCKKTGDKREEWDFETQIGYNHCLSELKSTLLSLSEGDNLTKSSESEIK